MLKRLRPGREAIELKIQGLGLPIVLRRSARARRFSLQVSEARRDAVLTLPAFSSYGEADEFLTRHLGWLRERLAKLADAVPFTHGSVIPLRGVSHRLEFAGSVRRRGVVWVETADDTPILVVSGATEHAPRRLHDWLKRQAHADLRQCVDVHARSAEPCAETHRRARPEHALGLLLHERGIVVLLEARSRRRPSCSIISPRTRSPISPR